MSRLSHNRVRKLIAESIAGLCLIVGGSLIVAAFAPLWIVGIVLIAYGVLMSISWCGGPKGSWSQ